jgi:tripartite ATP-independent transporter DctM subunit
VRWRIPVKERQSWAKRLISTRRASWTLGFPVIITGGIYSGIFSPTEAASVSVTYAIFVEIIVFKSLQLRDLPSIALSTGMITAITFILVGFGAAFSWTISFAQIPQAIISDLGMDQYSAVMVLFTIAVAFFVGCMFVDPIVVIFVLVPVFEPVITHSGIDPVLVGIVIVMQVAIGSATPPFGCDLFTAVAVFKRPYIEVIRGTPPFFVLLFLASVLVIVFPDISLLLRDLAFR